mmetsp:Transcript_10650/g.19328  ORF Transcript_10650/g.19328 Transcript_10650/m.19328 type:complete len:269 (+) Transcript_10650:62-868(+)
MDRRCGLPQDCAGGAVGWPCRRRRPATVGPPVEYTASKTDEVPDKQVHWCGTGNMPWTHGRARSAGVMRAKPPTDAVQFDTTGFAPGSIKGGAAAATELTFTPGTALEKAYRSRTESEFDLLVQVITDAMDAERPRDLFVFPPASNLRHKEVTTEYLSYEKRERIVLHALRRFPLCNVYDLLQCGDAYWAQISRELNGLGHGKAKRVAMERLRTQTTPLERASFWTTVRQPTWEKGKSCNFPRPSSRTSKRVAQPPDWWVPPVHSGLA